MKIKNFTLIASNHNLEIELKNLTKNANKIIFICSDFDVDIKKLRILYIRHYILLKIILKLIIQKLLKSYI